MPTSLHHHHQQQQQQQQLQQHHAHNRHHLYLTQWPLVSPLFSQNNRKYKQYISTVFLWIHLPQNLSDVSGYFLCVPFLSRTKSF
jgi:hypothetical protein